VNILRLGTSILLRVKLKDSYIHSTDCDRMKEENVDFHGFVSELKNNSQYTLQLVTLQDVCSFIHHFNENQNYL